MRVAARIASLAGASSEIVTHASRSRSGASVGRGGAVAAAAAAAAARRRRGGLAAGGRGRRAGGTVASARSRGGRGRDAVNHRACSRVRGTCGARPEATARGRRRRATVGGCLVHCHPGRAVRNWRARGGASHDGVISIPPLDRSCPGRKISAAQVQKAHRRLKNRKTAERRARARPSRTITFVCVLQRRLLCLG